MKITLFTGKTFEIREALGFDIKIVKSSRARRMTLRIDSKERLPVLTIPERCAAKRAVDFVNLHRGWIERSLARLPQTKNFEDGEQISLFGQPVVIRRTNDRRGGTFLENGFLTHTIEYCVNICLNSITGVVRPVCFAECNQSGLAFAYC